MGIDNCKGNKYLASLLCSAAVFAGMAAAQVLPNPIPARVLGQLNRPANWAETIYPSGVTPNLLEGRELFGPVSVVVDTSIDPPAVYVSDTKNNRVLGWRNAAEFQHGAFADIVIGQKDFFSSAPASSAPAPNPLVSTNYSALTLPAALAVGPGGNLFVYDAGNNRILRFPRPFDEANAAQKADLILGQVTRISRNPNQSASTSALPKATTLKSSVQASGQSTFLSSLAFDPEGNLWATDAGNHRVLRYAANDVNGPTNIRPNGEIEPQVAANRVLGQLSMELAVANQGRINNINDRIDKVRLRGPAALAFDTAGNLYLSDDLARVLFYSAPHDMDGKPAIRVLGVRSSTLPGVNHVEFGFQETSRGSGVFGEGARGVFCIGDVPFVVDSLNSRILRFSAPNEWPAEATQFSPGANGVIGQEDFNRGQSNRYDHWEPSPVSFSNPSSAVFANNEIWVADTNNNRVIAFPNFLEQGDTAPAHKLLGQVAFEFRAPNLIEGREFRAGSLTSSNDLGPAVVVDRSSDPPRLYVADTGNNRILGWSDARKAQGGDFAELQIGQVDFHRALVNSPHSDPKNPTKTGLLLPSVVAVDAEGNLWVADTGNSRVLRFPKPFENMEGERLPDLVIGAETYDAPATYTPSASTLGFPTGIAFSLDGRLYVSDVLFNRVLRFDAPFTSGMAATVVFGQPDFETTSSGAGLDKLNLPFGLAVDADDRLYVADAGNNRVAVFGYAHQATENGLNGGAPIRLTSGSMQPRAITVSHLNGDIWVVDASGSRVRRFLPYGPLQLSGTIASNYDIGAAGPRSLSLDPVGNLFMTDAANRLTVHFPRLVASNWENGFFSLAPGLVTRVQVPGVKLAEEAQSAGDPPISLELGGLEVLVNGQPSPIFSLSDEQGTGLLKIQIPSSAPIKGKAEIVIKRRETQEILASEVSGEFLPGGFFDASPAFMVQNSPGGGQVVAYNADGSKNSASNPAVRGSEVTLMLIGYGRIEGAPEDGTAAEVQVPLAGILLIGNQVQPLSSALDPTTPGVWRIRAKLDSLIVGSAGANYQVPVALLYKDILSNRTPYTVNGATGSIVTSIAIKP